MVGFRNQDVAREFTFPLQRFTKTVCVRDILKSGVGSEYNIEHIWRKRKNLRLPGMRIEALREAYKDPTWAKERSATSPTMEISPVAIIYGDTPSGLPRQQDKLYSTWGVSPTIATFSIPPFDVDGIWRLLTPRECARLQGLPDTFLLPKNDVLAYHQIGNSVAQNVVSAIASNILEVMP
jgi:site-specific DNA-cytosine methylase